MIRSKNKLSFRSAVYCCVYIFLLQSVSAWAACTGSSPNWASTADYASLSTCVAGAAPGDTITVSGNATWSATVILKRGVKLIGSGSPTITTEQSTGVFSLSPDASARANHESFTIRGFIFDGNNTVLSGGGLITGSNPSAKDYVNVVIMKNTFRNVIPANGHGLALRGSFWGVVAENIFDRVAIVIDISGIYGVNTQYDSWYNLTQAYGSAENLYLEDNIMIFSSTWSYTNHSNFIYSCQGGRIAVRYNTWDYTNAAQPGEFWDIHGLQSDQYSTMVAEYYGNMIINQKDAYRWMYHRGGWLLMFYNAITGNTSPGIQITQYTCNSQVPGGYNQKPTNTYLWRNLANGNDRKGSFRALDYGCLSDPIIENYDYFNYNDTFNGTSGVGCGPLSARPATCTTGVGYWATNQSCTNLTGMVGANPATPISGTLYKCTSTNTWTAYYTPYQYPHPLRSGWTSQTTSPIIAGNTTTSTIIAGNTTSSTTTTTSTITTDTPNVKRYIRPGLLKKISR